MKTNSGMSVAFSATVGAWTVEVSPMTGVTAEKRSNGELWGASLTRFPIGYRVGKYWSNGVAEGEPRSFGIPAAVVKKADALANRLTKEGL